MSRAFGHWLAGRLVGKDDGIRSLVRLQSAIEEPAEITFDAPLEQSPARDMAATLSRLAVSVHVHSKGRSQLSEPALPYERIAPSCRSQPSLLKGWIVQNQDHPHTTHPFERKGWVSLISAQPY